MNILYHIPYTNSTGADRWIYEGWRDAFRDCGHNFYELTDYDDWREKVLVTNPDIFFVTNFIDNLNEKKEFLTWLRSHGTKIFLIVDWPMRGEDLEVITKDVVADFYFGEREPESMVEFERATGQTYHVIPNAANRLLHFPAEAVRKYQFDIVYLGANLPKKKWFTDNILLPLKTKYKVGVFGPYWTLRDNMFRTAQRFCRKARFKRGADYFNKLRIVIPPDEENQLYSSAKICLNFHEREEDGSQPHYILNQRTFKIPACGGFQICDYVPALRKYFSEDEVVMFESKEDFFKKIAYFLRNEKERKSIQKKGSEKALKEHTYHNRVDLVLNLCRGLMKEDGK